MKLGIIGLPNVGKSALFNAITNSSVASENYPFCTIEPNKASVAVPDIRLKKLSELYKSKKTINATIEFVDIAGIVKGASKGEGLGNKFLSHIKEMDALIHVVRCFTNSDIEHIYDNVDPMRDIEIIELELIFSDIEKVMNKIEKTKKNLKFDKKYEQELLFYQKLLDHLEQQKNARDFKILNNEEKKIVNSLELLSFKPMIYVANLNENVFISGFEHDKNFKKIKQKISSITLPICAELEAQISQFNPNEKKEFLSASGIEESGLEILIKAGYNLLNLISFITAGPEETRAWTIKNGTCAKEAAGKIHSDIERGFIKAQIVSYEKLMEYGSLTIAKEKGFLNFEGKEYVMKDGDVTFFKFNV